MNSKTSCICGSTFRTCDRKRHESTKTHQEYIKNNHNDNQVGIASDNLYESDSDDNISDNENNDGFLDGLNNDVYVSQSDIEAKKKQDENLQKEADKVSKQNEKTRKENERYIKSLSKAAPKVNHIVDDDDNLFSSNPTTIHGKEKLVLIKKASQFKIMFKDELKIFKIKKGANVEELNVAINEMQTIIETKSTDQFVTDGILASLKMVEGYTVNSQNYNISGLADLLKLNPEFNNLSKQLFLKYGSFSNISAEYKLMFLVFTSAYIVRNKNKNKGAINDFLNEPYESK